MWRLSLLLLAAISFNSVRRSDASAVVKRSAPCGGGAGCGAPCPDGGPSLGIPCDAKRPWPACPPQSYCYATNSVDIGPYYCCPVWSTRGAQWRPTAPFYNYVPPMAPNWGGAPGLGGAYPAGAVSMPLATQWPGFWPKAARKMYQTAKKKTAVVSTALKRKKQASPTTLNNEPAE